MRLHYTSTRVIVMVLVGLCAGVTVSLVSRWELGLVVGWCAAALTYIIMVWANIWGMDSPETARHATSEDPGRRGVDILVVCAAVASLLAVGVLLGTTSHSLKSWPVGVATFASVMLSWALIHTLYTLRYARQYYQGVPGGIDFNNGLDPQYADFAYFAFGLGMTFQVADTNVSTTAFRKIILGHTLLAYLFNTVLIASVINLLIGLAGGL